MGICTTFHILYNLHKNSQTALRIHLIGELGVSVGNLISVYEGLRGLLENIREQTE